MSYSQAILDAIDRLNNFYNSNAFNAGTNPGGFANDGHQVNFPASLDDVSNVGAAVGGAADAAALSETATGEDRIQTGLDATETGQDRIATGLDATATGQDRIATGLNATATGEDRIQTGLDATATGQDQAKAQKWAEEVEDIEVEAGKYSSLHYAAKAAASAAAAEAPVLISEITASAASTVDFTADLGLFPRYMITLDGVQTSSDDDALLMRVSYNAGTSFVSTSTYRRAINRLADNGTRYDDVGAAIASLILSGAGGAGIGIGNATGENLTGVLRWSSTAGVFTLFNIDGTYINTAGKVVTVNGGGYESDSSSAVTGIRFLLNSGTISGRFKLYGLS